MSARLFLIQRLTALLMIPLILGHIAVIFYATRTSLGAAEVLGRTRGSIGWGAFYSVFVLLAAVHGAIGVRSVAREWTRLDARSLDVLMWGFGLLLLGLGIRAVYAVIA